MSEIKNGGLDQYGKVLSLNGIGGERVKTQTQVEQCVNWNSSPRNLVAIVLYNDGIVTSNWLAIKTHASYYNAHFYVKLLRCVRDFVYSITKMKNDLINTYVELQQRIDLGL